MARDDNATREEATISVNGGPAVPLATVKEALDIVQGRSAGNVAADELRLLIERIERLEEEKKGLADDIKDVYGEAKSRGYVTTTMREIVKLRRMESHVRTERGALIATYAEALGLQLGFDL